MKRKGVIYSMIFLVFLMMACAAGVGNTGASEATQMAVGIQQTQNANIQETISAATMVVAVPTQKPTDAVNLVATQVQETVAAAALQTAAAQPTVQPTTPAVSAPAAAASPTVEDQTEGDFSKIDKYVRADSGTYYTMEPVRQSWTDKENYWESLRSEEASNFVFSTTVSWTAPQDMAEPARYGCGFIYGKSDPKHFHVTYVSPDQKVHTIRKRGSEVIEMKGGPVPGGGLGTYSGTAQLVVVVEDKVMTAYVNDIQVVTFIDPYIDFGKLGLAISNASYSGFTCSFEDIELWILD